MMLARAPLASRRLPRDARFWRTRRRLASPAQSQTVVTDKPIYIDIRPWGSMSTIIAHQFMLIGRKPPVAIAGMLLCAILSCARRLLLCPGPLLCESSPGLAMLVAETRST